MKTISYLCLQATQEGQASYAHVHEIIKGLKKRNETVRLYQPNYARKKKPPGALKRLLEFIRIQMTMVTSARDSDVLYIRSHFAAFPISLWAKVKGIPVVQEVNGPYEDLFIAWPLTKKFSKLFKWLVRKQLEWATAVITVTDQLKEWVAQETDRNHHLYVIPNGANTELFHPNAKESNCKLPEQYAVFFGALAPWQGIKMILEATKEADWPSDLPVVIVGDGVERDLVIEESKANLNVIYLGKQPYNEMPSIVAHALVGLSPQNNLGNRASTGLFPLKVFETLSCGIPVIVTDYPGQGDLVKENDCGMVIPPEDSKALAQAVKILFQNSEERERMGKKGRELIELKHSWDFRGEQTHQVVKRIIHG